MKINADFSCDTLKITSQFSIGDISAVHSSFEQGYQAALECIADCMQLYQYIYYRKCWLLQCW